VADAGSTIDAAADAGADAGSAIEITFTSPADEPAHVSSDVTFQLFVQGEAERVELHRDGAPFAVLPPPHSVPWDVDTEDDGTYAFEARALVGGAVAASATRTVVLDRDAPSIVSIAPADGSEIAVDGPITVVFSEPVRDASIAGAVELAQGATARLFATTLSPDGRTLTIRPTDLAAETPVMLSIAATITDLARNPLRAGAARTYAVPAWLSILHPSDAFGRDAVIEVDATGAPILARYEATGPAGTPAIVVERWDGAAWSALGREATSIAPGPILDLRIRDADGSLFLGWVQASDYLPRVSRWTGRDWEELPPGPGAGTTSVHLAFDRTTAVFVTSGPDVLRWDFSAGRWATLPGPRTLGEERLTQIEHARGRVVAGRIGRGACGIVSILGDGSFVVEHMAGGVDFMCRLVVLGLHGTAGATATTFYEDCGGGRCFPGSDRVLLDAPAVAGERTPLEYAATPAGYAILTGGVPFYDVFVEGAELPGTLPDGCYDLAYRADVAAVLWWSGSAFGVSRQVVR
jgi:hypothetical protein